MSNETKMDRVVSADELKELRDWQYKVASALGYVNHAEGQSGYEVASADVVVKAIEKLQHRVKAPPEPLLDAQGRFENFMFRNPDGSGFRCECVGNVFHKPDKLKPHSYECNSCGARYVAEHPPEGHTGYPRSST